MNSQNYYHQKNERFLEYWEKRRTNRLKFSVLQGSYFSIPISIILTAFNFGIEQLLSTKLLVYLISSFILYSVLNYLFTFRAYEKRYHKLKKAKQNFDH